MLVRRGRGRIEDSARWCGYRGAAGRWWRGRRGWFRCCAAARLPAHRSLRSGAPHAATPATRLLHLTAARRAFSLTIPITKRELLIDLAGADRRPVQCEQSAGCHSRSSAEMLGAIAARGYSTPALTPHRRHERARRHRHGDPGNEPDWLSLLATAWRWWSDGPAAKCRKDHPQHLARICTSC